TLQGHSDKVYAVSFSPDSQILASAGKDKTIKLWRRDGKLLRTLSRHQDQILAVSFSPLDGKTIASA
ncbi:MAG TPA: hypothetical protein DCP31_18615, partial [Cyanobacteria bacterium UBA8543]|nr:hypothetical protein [Cyanobacteria bacterium UBA8543]